MAITLYDATVPHFLSLLASLRGILNKGLDHAKAAGLEPDALANARLADDMFPLHLQVRRAVDHSQGALEDVARGAWTMPVSDPLDYAGAQRLVADAEKAVQGWSREAVDALEGRETIFDTGSQRTVFASEAFLLSFSLPNFYFHAVTAYDILRAQGVPIGKRDYLGQLRTKVG